jgi:hypothetical protein
VIPAHTPVIPRQEVARSLMPPTVTASVTFAAGIVQRHAARPLTVSRAELALAWQPAGDVATNNSTSRVTIAPVVAIHEHPLFTAVTKSFARIVDVPPAYGDAQASALFRRLFSRQGRISAIAGTSIPPAAGRVSAIADSSIPPAFGAMPSGPSFRLSETPRNGAVERTLPRPPKSEAAASKADRAPVLQQNADMQEWGRRPLSSAEPQPITLAPPEMRRVTEQVIREIDHRLAAGRERMGRR